MTKNTAISVITPFSRGVKELSTLLNDLQNQTFRDFEWIVVRDGKPSNEINKYVKENFPPWAKFFWIDKDMGNTKIAPGTKPRNYGLEKASSNHTIFFDDDDRMKDSYLFSLMDGTCGDTICCVQMSCSEARMYKNGDPKVIRLVPELWLPTFPVMCHIGTPTLCLRREWCLDLPWREEPEHDIRFFRRILEKYHPKVLLKSGLQVDVDGAIVGGLKDWVTQGPYSTKIKPLIKEYPSNRIIF